MAVSVVTEFSLHSQRSSAKPAFNRPSFTHTSLRNAESAEKVAQLALTFTVS